MRLHKTLLPVFLFLFSLSTVPAAEEVLFKKGPQEFGGKRYYWLAEWKLEITLPGDVKPSDTLEVLFGTKGSRKRTLYIQYNKKTKAFSHADKKDGYTWIPLDLEKLSAGRTVALSGKGREFVAFIAGVRITGSSAKAPQVKPVQTVAYPGRTSQNALYRAHWVDLPGFEATPRTRALWNEKAEKPDWNRAERSARYAGTALGKVQRWLHECCMAVQDETSKLFRPTGRVWTYRDTAADCYPFYVWAAYYTDMELLKTVMIETLNAEQKLCNHLDRLPVRYDMDEGRKIVTDFNAMIFGACEYVKDGLVPIVEITGKSSPWFDRMQEITDDIFKHARIETPYGKIPSTNIEVNGELLQILPRLFTMTGRRKYLDWAHRLADYYLLPGRFVPERLSDHGCEIIGGLGLLYAVDTKACPEKAGHYKPHLEYMFDSILKRGTNSHGMIIGRLQKTAGPHDKAPIWDGWGYDFVGFLDYDIASNTKRYEEAMRRPMKNILDARYFRFNWGSGSRDNIADSVEGGLYLLYRIPLPETFIWADREIATCLVDHTNPDRLWGVHKLEANTVRTVLIHTMLHTRNTIARPWIQGLELGAAPCGKGICVVMKSQEPYKGKLEFDVPRHRLFMGFSENWPRMNTVPEWFAVEPDATHKYKVYYVDSDKTETCTGKKLSEGLPVEVNPDRPLRLVVTPYQSPQ